MNFVILQYFPHEPVHVYGLFASAEEAYAYAERQGFAASGGAYSVHGILDIEEEPQ